MHLVLIETAGNQAFIFATNRQRENVGASELVAEVGTEFVADALASPELGSVLPGLAGLRGAALRTALTDPAGNPPIESGKHGAELVLAVSGKSLILVEELAVARALVTAVTCRALEVAPGLEVRGAISQPFTWGSKPLHAVVGEVHHRLEVLRSQLPGTELRFPRLPFVEECASSGLPASAVVKVGDDERALSAVSIAKRQAAKAARARLAEQVGKQRAADVGTSADELFVESERVAVIHADGNGIGQVFLSLDQRAKASGPGDGRGYIQALRELSLGLAAATEGALQDALANVPREKKLLPLVLGGDDLTVLCDADTALAFTRDYLRAFERRTGAAPGVSRLAGPGGRFAACAGIAIVKPNHPFFSAYGLAEDLLKSAKSVKVRVSRGGTPWPCSALDFHVLLDSSSSTLEGLRAQLRLEEPDGPALLTAKPYVVTPLQDLSGCDGEAWWRPRHLGTLEASIAALQARDGEGRRTLPSSQVNDLRRGLFLGVREADGRLDLVRRPERLGPLVTGRSLFFGTGPGEPRATRLLDAIEAEPHLAMQGGN